MSETNSGEWNFIPTLGIIHIWWQPKKSRNFNQEILTIGFDQKIQKKSECDINLPLSLLTDVWTIAYLKKK